MPSIRVKARALLREAGYPDGLAVTLIAPSALEVQATVVGKMLEQVGFTVERQMLDPAVYNRKTRLPELDQPAEQQAWDIALTSWNDAVNFPAIQPYHVFALDGPSDWVIEAAGTPAALCAGPTHRGSGAPAGANPPDGTAHP